MCRCRRNTVVPRSTRYTTSAIQQRIRETTRMSHFSLPSFLSRFLSLSASVLFLSLLNVLIFLRSFTAFNSKFVERERKDGSTCRTLTTPAESTLTVTDKAMACLSSVSPSCKPVLSSETRPHGAKLKAYSFSPLLCYRSPLIVHTYSRVAIEKKQEHFTSERESFLKRKKKKGQRTKETIQTNN